MFTSFKSTSLEKTVILAQHRAHLSLISNQAEETFKAGKIKKKPDENSTPKTSSSKDKSKTPVYKDERNKRYGLESSKLNLWPLLHEKDKIVSTAVYKSAIRLIQILYQEAEFYKKANDPDLARKIIDAMVAKKKEDLFQLFPQDPSLAEIYYKMLKGSNTNYPPLSEYLKIEKTDQAPIQWAYASTPVLRAVIGDPATKQILAAEKAAWEANPRTRILPKETLKNLLLKHANLNFDAANLEAVFLFDRSQKGIPHTYMDEQSKVTASK